VQRESAAKQSRPIPGISNHFLRGNMKIYQTIRTIVALFVKHVRSVTTAKSNQKEIHCVYIESFGGDSAYWWPNAEDADTLYLQAVGPNSTWSTSEHTVSRYVLKVPFKYSKEEIQRAVEMANWDKTYEPIAQRKVIHESIGHKPSTCTTISCDVLEAV
jgi:hypothetical protein